MDFTKHLNELFVFILLIGVTSCNCKPDDCLSLETSGKTYPSGDILLEYGQPLNITCTLYDYVLERDGKDASYDLFFTRDNETVPNEMVEVLNSTSARLYIDHPNEVGDNRYACWYKTDSNMVCMNTVIIGVKPQNVTDFACVSRNYDNLTCTWTPPNNSVKTNYSLFFKLKSKSSDSSKCPEIKPDGSKMSCVWTMDSVPQYRPAQTAYYFNLSMSNYFGTNTLMYYFDHFKYVVPNAPQNLRPLETTPHSIKLFWQLPSSMKEYPRSVQHRILYQCEYYPKQWQFGGLITQPAKTENITFELKNLKYAHALCDIRVSMRSALANHEDESAWSENATKTVRTKSKIPDGPPQTNIGSFLISSQISPFSSRNIFVHWKTIREESRNGQNFQYKVEVENLGITNYTTKSFIQLLNLPAAEYKINIWSQNDEGTSKEKATLTVPSRRLPEPQNFIRIAHNDMFQLKWDPPKTESKITNYTIFWCRSENDKYSCDGYLDWETVPQNITQYNLTLPRNVTHQIAISANGLNSSSGMLWADCIIIPGKNVGKLKSVYISNVGSDFIEVDWKVDCSDYIAAAQGFVIKYCQIEKAQTDCNKGWKNVTIMNKNAQRGRVPNLKPYSRYQLTVAVMISESVFSEPSDFMYNTTREAAPSTPPLNVRITNITESSFVVHWDPPAEINGKLKFYLLYTNISKPYNVEADKNNFTITNLESFGTYEIRMEACTVACSAKSEPLIVTTKIGVPSVISRPIIIEANSSLVTIGWQEPTYARGRNEYYQLKFSDKASLANQAEGMFLNVTSKNYTTSCDSSKGTYYVSVRAVNIIDNEHKAGPFSEPLQLNNCTSPLFIYIFVAILFIVVVAAVYFGSKKLFFYFNSMKDVQVKLPPGLQTVVDQQPWGSTKHSDDIDRIPKPDPDEELLLDKFPDIRLSVDTTGTPTPSETLTTPIDSIPHLTTDLTKKTSLRQRNKGYSTTDSAKTTQSPGNYCVLGVDPSKALSPETRYLPGLDDDSPTPAYVAVDDIVKIPNPGYIPYTVSEPEEKNKGYVMAGMPKDLLVQDLLQCEPQKQHEEASSGYVKASDALSPQKCGQFPWEQGNLDSVLMKSGYVSVGDAMPPKNVSDVPRGYVPHRQFDATKSIKED